MICQKMAARRGSMTNRSASAPNMTAGSSSMPSESYGESTWVASVRTSVTTIQTATASHATSATATAARSTLGSAFGSAMTAAYHQAPPRPTTYFAAASAIRAPRASRHSSTLRRVAPAAHQADAPDVALHRAEAAADLEAVAPAAGVRRGRGLVDAPRAPRPRSAAAGAPPRRDRGARPSASTPGDERARVPRVARDARRQALLERDAAAPRARP